MMSKYDTEIVIYQSEDGQTKVDVRFEDETVWLSQKQLVELFQSSKANISEHIKSIYDEGELDEASTVRKIRTVQNEGSREVTRNITYYDPDSAESIAFFKMVQNKLHYAAIVIEKNIAPAVSLEYTLCTAYSYHCMGYQ